MPFYLFHLFIYFTNLFIIYFWCICVFTMRVMWHLLQSLFYVFCWRAQLTTVLMMMMLFVFNHIDIFYILKKTNTIISHVHRWTVNSSVLVVGRRCYTYSQDILTFLSDQNVIFYSPGTWKQTKKWWSTLFQFITFYLKASN